MWETVEGCETVVQTAWLSSVLEILVKNPFDISDKINKILISQNKLSCHVFLEHFFIRSIH